MEVSAGRHPTNNHEKVDEVLVHSHKGVCVYEVHVLEIENISEAAVLD